MSSFAPYNFIPFSGNVSTPVPYKKTDEDDKDQRSVLPKHDRFSEQERMTGEIEYELHNLTKMCVGASSKNKKEKPFFRDGQGRLAIPGSTMRGFFRSHAELLSFAYPEMIENKRFLYRSFADASKKFRDEYHEKMSSEGSEIGLIGGVKAGYIYCVKESTGTNYYIMPVKEFGAHGTTYFKLHEANLRKANALQDAQYMYNEQIGVFKSEAEKPAAGAGKSVIAEWEKKVKEEYKAYQNELKGKKNRNYKAYRAKTTKSFDYGKFVEIKPGGAFRGVLLNSSYIGGKTHHYLVSEEILNTADPIPVSRELIVAYKADLDRNKIQNPALKFNDEFYALPSDSNRDGGKKDVLFDREKKDADKIKQKGKLFFYSAENGRVTGFGPTPYFRIPYEHQVENGIPYAKNQEYDFIQALFGFADPKKSYRGRVSFQNAGLIGDAAMEVISLMNAGSPGATSFQMYLDQKEGPNDISVSKLKNYNDDDFVLRGYKVYLKRREPIRSKESRNANMDQKIEFLKEDGRFRGKIFFENLSAEELGLLLLSIRYSDATDKEESYMLGAAKAYGYGKVSVENVKVRVRDVRTSLLSVNEKLDDRNPAEFKAAYIDALKAQYGIDFKETETVKTYEAYIFQKDASEYLKSIPNGYMEFGSVPTYKNREPLGTLLEVVAGKYSSRGVQKRDAFTYSTGETETNDGALCVYWRNAKPIEPHIEQAIKKKLGTKKIRIQLISSPLDFFSIAKCDKKGVVVYSEQCRMQKQEMDQIKNYFGKGKLYRATKSGIEEV